MLGAVEAGGTKFVCAVSKDGRTVEHREQFPTRSPEETLTTVFEYFEQHQVEAIGIGSFGPVDIKPTSASYGYIEETPKLDWRNFNLLGKMKNHFPGVKFAFTTDVNAAACGEFKEGAGKEVSDLVYWTVGTGIGAGIILNGRLMQGYGHPEVGHILVKRHPDDDFIGVCPYHKDCLEGLASGPAIESRYGTSAKAIPESSSAWDIETYYLAQACMNVTLTVAPEKIILGGGVMHQSQMIPLIREKFEQLLAGYVKTPPLEHYITSIDLHDDAGVIGGFQLAKQL
ncbi:ROK family protein [Lacticaseibacillus paracasei]|uniref:ROK family protein n=1 Tax=Lacticaseibacillus paracasei TaxID=1597 RepID=UPI00386BDEE2